MRSRQQKTLAWSWSRQTFAHEKFLDRAVRFVDSLIGEGRGAGVGVGDRHLAETLPAENVRALLRWQFRIGESVIGVGIAQRPAVYGDGQNVVRRAETGRAQHTVKLAANLKLEILKGRGPQFALAR